MGSSSSEVREGGAATGSHLRTVGTAVGLGLLGPGLLLAFGQGLLVAIDAVEIPPLVLLLLVFVVGPYVAIGGLAFAYLWYRGFDWPRARSYLGIGVPSLRDLALVVGGWVAIFGSLILVGVVVQSLGASPAENQTAELAQEAPALIPVLIAVMFLVVGPLEELLYRGVVQGRLRETLGPVPSIVIASAVFAAIHWAALTGGAAARLTTIALLFVPSLVFGAVYEYTHNLVAVALLHAVHNSVLLALLYATLVAGGQGTAVRIVGSVAVAAPC